MNSVPSVQIPVDTQKIKDSFSLSPVKNNISISAKLLNSVNNFVTEISKIFKNIQKNGIGFLGEIFEAILITAVSVSLIFGTHLLFRRLSNAIVSYGEKHFKAITLKKYRILDQKQILRGVLFSLKFVKYTLSMLILFMTIPLIFGIFPQTHDFAVTLWGYFLSPVKTIFFGIVNYIPKLITIIVILFFVKYVLKMLKFFSNEIENGKLIIKGFYPDWAKPTYLLLKYMIYIFTIAVIFPYLPYSDTRVFQSISLFVGVIISLGSSSAIGNLVAGLVITYMRPFKIGDRIKIGENVGMVVEKTAVVVRIRTDKKEYVTFPNITILTSNITNFSYSNESGNGLIIHADITYNYSVEWRKIHELLIKAAKKTQFIEETPEPFVFQKSLDNFYCVYEINAYTKEIAGVMQVYSELHKNIQDAFRDAGLDLTTPDREVYETIETK
ncbi:MAG: mechanosensitive ion channel family protein [Chitinispirillales bacterium]|nr:mechanosensitive ion channel family protein [Chitinispirillales bacterium]